MMHILIKTGWDETFIISQGLKKARDQVRLSLQQAAQITPIRVQNIELTERPDEKALYIIFTILDFPIESIPPEVNVSSLPPEVTILLPGAVNNLKSVVSAGNLKIELPQTTGVSRWVKGDVSCFSDWNFVRKKIGNIKTKYDQCPNF